jgi:CheY-like chemotaxis protein
MNGYDAARAIRATPWGKDMTLIALTGWGQAEDQARAKEAGFDHHFTKPVDIDKLQAVLRPDRLQGKEKRVTASAP